MVNINEDKFKCFVRYLINTAKQKRCVPYHELENIFGLSRKDVGWYAGKLGDFCNEKKLPPLNGLIINTTTCTPSHGFNWYLENYKKSWGEIVSDCWKKFHITSSHAKRFKDFSGLDAEIEPFFEE